MIHRTEKHGLIWFVRLFRTEVKKNDPKKSVDDRQLWKGSVDAVRDVGIKGCVQGMAERGWKRRTLLPEIRRLLLLVV